MNLFLIFLFIPLCLVFSHSDVLHLTRENFQKTIQSQPYVLVLFFAPWCYWSRQLLAELARAAEKSYLIGNAPSTQSDVGVPILAARGGVLYGQVDCAVEEHIALSFGIRDYPVMKLFVDGRPHEVSAGRTANEIVNWVNHRLFNREHSLMSVEEFQRLSKHSDLTVLLIASGEVDRAPFVRLSRRFDEVLFLDTGNISAAFVESFNLKDSSTDLGGGYAQPQAAHSVFKKRRVSVTDEQKAHSSSASSTDNKDQLNRKPPVVIMLTPKSLFDHQNMFSLSYSPSSISSDNNNYDKELDAFVFNHLFPMICPFSPDYAARLFNDGRALIIYIHQQKNIQQPPDSFKQVANIYRGKYLFVFSGTGKNYEKRLADLIGLETVDDEEDNHKKQVATIRIVKVSKSSSSTLVKFAFDGQDVGNAREVNAFVKAFERGELTQFYRSEPEEEHHKNTVKTLVGHSFNRIARDPNKDVLVQCLAPWCGHCRKLLSVFKELAELFSKVSSVVIATIDSTRNEIPNLPIDVFPTILFFPAWGSDNDNPIEFKEKNNRTTEELRDFILKHAGVRIDMTKLFTSDQTSASNSFDMVTTNQQPLNVVEEL
eukprot:TRINITY_DN135_c0_g1_i1.p1 TRINITY_DN135_c0_g1~~TRINITY_DN135_c0_g1_i1.p1  ORF type:complete len:598 (-),score=59.63 TRINITY_DN135_c0_g1_i1:189-1982(-)